MDSPCPRRQRRTWSTSHESRRHPVVTEAGGDRLGGRPGDRAAPGVLARIYKMARKFPTRIGRGLTAGVAANGDWFLCTDRNGSARTAWKSVAIALWPQPGIHVYGAGAGFAAVQFSVCRATAGGVV